MTFRLVHTSYSLPKWQAVKLTFFAPCFLLHQVKTGWLATLTYNSQNKILWYFHSYETFFVRSFALRTIFNISLDYTKNKFKFFQLIVLFWQWEVKAMLRVCTALKSPLILGEALEKSLNSIFPWKVLQFVCKSFKRPWIFFNFECMFPRFVVFFVLPLLLATLTSHFSLDRQR